MTQLTETQQQIRAKYAEKGAIILGSDPESVEAPVFSLSLEGLEGSGKTHFIAMTMPLPLVMVNFGDRAAKPFLYKMDAERRKDVVIYDLQPKDPQGWTEKESLQSLIALTEIMRAEGPSLEGGTFAIDGGSSWWTNVQNVFVAPREAARIAAGDKKSGGLVYIEANSKMRGTLGWLRQLGCFVVVTHQLAQDWDAKGPIPGQYSASQFNKVPYLVDIVVRLFKVCTKCGAPQCQSTEPGHVGRVHKARIEKFGASTKFEGMVLNDLTFEKLYTLYTGVGA